MNTNVLNSDKSVYKIEVEKSYNGYKDIYCDILQACLNVHGIAFEINNSSCDYIILEMDKQKK